MPFGGLCPWPTFHASVTKAQNGNSGAPVMVPSTIMSIGFQKYYSLIINLQVLDFTSFSGLYSVGILRHQSKKQEVNSEELDVLI